MIDPRPGPSKDSRDEKTPRAGPGQCKVCEGPATGYHYSVPACPACKTFFRRVVINQRRYLCIDRHPSDRNANSLEHLRICKKCRFDRCVNAGMDPMAVVASSEEALSNVIVRDILNRRRSSSSDGSSDKSSSPELQMVIQPRAIEQDVQVIIDRMTHIEMAHTKIRLSQYHPASSLESTIEGPSKFGMEYGEMPGWPIKWEEFVPAPSVANCLKTASPFPSNLDQRPSNAKRWHIADPSYGIEFTKTFDFFRGLETKDKIIICKHAALMVAHLTQAFYSYQKGSLTIEFPDGYKPFKVNIPKDSEADVLVYSKAIGIITTLKMDETEYILLKAIVACNPAYFGLSPSAHSILTVEREKYAKSLLSYVLERRGVEKGPSAFASMMAFVSTLENICFKIREILHALHALGVFSQVKTPVIQMDLI